MAFHLTSQRKLAVLGLAAALLLSACSKSGAGNTAGTGDTIKLGWISDLTGAASIAGIGNRDGALLAAETINNAGGVLGRKLELDVVDEACKPDTALAAAQRFLDDAKTFMIVGGSCSGDVLAMKDLVTQAKVPFYVASASSAAIASPLSKYVFANMVLTDDEARFLTESAIQKFKPKKLGVIFSANDYGKTGSKFVIETAQKAGVKIGAPVEAPVGTTDFSPFILLLKKEGVDVVLPVLYEVPAFTKQAKQNGLTANLVYSGALPLRSAMTPLGASGLLAGLSTSFWSPNTMGTDSKSPAMAKFVTDFHAKYNKYPDTADLNGYSSIYIIKTVLEKAGKVDRETFINTIETMGPIDNGLTFPHEFSKDNHAGLKKLALITFKDNTVPGPNGLFGTAEIFVP